MILSQRVAEEAAEPLGVPVLPSLPYGMTPYFGAYPGSPTRRRRDLSARCCATSSARCTAQGFRRFLIVNGHGGNAAGRHGAGGVGGRARRRAGRSGTTGGRRRARARSWTRSTPTASHASWMENFPWTRLRGRRAAAGPQADSRTSRRCAPSPPAAVRELLGDGSLGGYYERPDDDVLRVWAAGVEETRELLEHGWAMPDRGRVALVTGTAHGIGAAIAAALEAEGATVHGVDRDTVRRQRLRRGGRVRRPRSGASTCSSTTPAASSARSGGRWRRSRDEDWRAVVDANLTSTFLCTRAVAPGMKARGLGAHREHLLRRRAQRQPDRDPGLREREGRAARVHPPDRARARAVRDHGQRDRAGVRALEPDLDRPVGVLRRRGPGARCWSGSRCAGSAGRRTSPTASSSSSPEAAWVTGQVISIDGGSALF